MHTIRRPHRPVRGDRRLPWRGVLAGAAAVWLAGCASSAAEVPAASAAPTTVASTTVAAAPTRPVPSTTVGPTSTTAVASTSTSTSAATTAVATDRHPVTFELVAATPAGSGAQLCTADGAACVVPLAALTTTLTGDLSADVVSSSSISTRGDRLAAVALIVLSGAVSTCGQGTLALVVSTTLRLDGATAQDAISTWRVVDGSGTGDLGEVTGGGDGGEGTGTMTGEISCGAP